MRHRAPTPLARLLSATRARRGAAAGTVVLLGASSGAYVLVADDWSPGEAGSVVAEPAVGERDGTSNPGAVTLKSLRDSRTPPTTRGQARTRPSDALSARPDPTPATALPGVTRRPPSLHAAAPTGTAEARAAGDPTSGTPSSPSQPSEPAPGSPPPSSAPAPAPTGPETTAVTQVAAGGTWTIALSSDSTVTSFECSLDGAAYSACGPAVSYAGLSNGRHTLSARAVDGAGTVDPSPAVVTTNVTGTAL